MKADRFLLAAHTGGRKWKCQEFRAARFSKTQRLSSGPSTTGVHRRGAGAVEMRIDAGLLWLGQRRHRVAGRTRLSYCRLMPIAFCVQGLSKEQARSSRG